MYQTIVRWVRMPGAVILVLRAIHLRNAARWGQAAELFERAIPRLPNHQQVCTQAGNCRKEQGQFALAIAHYDRVTDPTHHSEALFQKAQVLLKLGDRDHAIRVLKDASAKQHANATRLLRELNGGEAGIASIDGPVRSGPFPALNQPIDEAALPKRLTTAGSSRRWLRSLDKATHKAATEGGFGSEPQLDLIQVGWFRLESGDVEEALLLGVNAIRARLLAKHTVAHVAIKLDGTEIHRATPTLVKQGPDGFFYILNAWVDFERYKPQRAKLTLEAIDEAGAQLTAGVVVNLCRAPPGLKLPDSDAYVPSTQTHDANSTVEAVLARPAEVRGARRSLFASNFKHVLAMRVDQLGDIAASLPAMQRLRAVFPTAKLTGLVSPGLVAVVEATGIFDQVYAAELIYSHTNEQRFIERDEERRLSALFHDEPIDLAIDLCPGGETRALLQIFKARFLAGFDPHLFDFLDFGIMVRAQDKVNRLNAISHAAQVMMLIESIAIATQTSQPSVSRIANDTDCLSQFKLSPRGYVVIHSGARHAINCWPRAKFVDLAIRTHRELKIDVVLFTDETLGTSELAQIQPTDCVLIMPRIPFDQFDAVLANAKLFIGNDSGPKHLAAVHGVETISIHINRLNWREWGQDGDGVIISKRVPCAGCGLNNETLCGMDVACIRSITVDEVHSVVQHALSEQIKKL